MMPLRLRYTHGDKVLRVGWRRIMPDGRILWAEKWDTYGRPLWTGPSDADYRHERDLENVSTFAAELCAQVEMHAPLVARGRAFSGGRPRGSTDALGRWLEAYAEQYPNARTKDVFNALRRDPDAEAGDAVDTVWYGGRRRTRKAIANRWAKIRNRNP